MTLRPEYLHSLLEDDPEQGIYRCKREMFTDPRLFDLEMKHIFEGNWVYLAHESQIPNNNDYYTIYMGRQPIVITRNKDGELNAFVNACTHRGAMLCRHKTGNKQLTPARSTAGPSTTPASCSRSRTGRSGLPGQLQLRRLPRPDEGGALRDATAASCSAASTPTCCRWTSTWARRPRSST